MNGAPMAYWFGIVVSMSCLAVINFVLIVLFLILEENKEVELKKIF